MFAKTVLSLITLLALASPAFAQDADSDGIPDSLDPCIDDDRNVGSLGCDTDADGYGNVCDGDFNQSDSVTGIDYSMFWVPDGITGIDSGRGTDMNCSGTVTGIDYSMFFVPQGAAGIPGGSGLACRGFAHCRPNIEAKILQQQIAGYTPQCSSPYKITVVIPGGAGGPPDDTPNSTWLGIYPHDRCTLISVSGDDNAVEDGVDVDLPQEFPFNVVRFDFPEALDSYAGFNEITASTGLTYGSRVYLRYSSGFGSSSNTGVFRLAANISGGSPTNDPGIEFEWADFDTLNMLSGLSDTPHGSVDGGTTTFAGDAGVDRADCVDGWCRFEHFYDHDTTTNKLTVRARLVVITGTDAGKSISVNEELPNAVSVPVTGAFRIWRNENVSAGSWINAESIWISHAAGTVLNYAPSYWLDKAYEIEGY